MATSVDFSVFSVLVTGSDRGIGLGLVKRFLELPSPPKWVFATTLDLEGEANKELKELSRKYRNLVVFLLHVTDFESFQAVVKEMQKYVGENGLTLLVNNAGLPMGNNLESENAKDMMRVYSVNTIRALQMSQACLPLLKLAARRSPCQRLSSSRSAIINISSILGSIELMECWDIMQRVASRCSMTALNMLTKCQSLDYSSHGILCVALHPGWVKTPKTEVSVLTQQKGKLTRTRTPVNMDDLTGDTSLEEITQGIITVLSLLSNKDNGTFVDCLGRRIPW